MTGQNNRLRASERPDTTARWARVAVEGDLSQPFKYERSGDIPARRPRWWPFGGRK